jgi:hypothetical protein
MKETIINRKISYSKRRAKDNEKLGEFSVFQFLDIFEVFVHIHRIRKVHKNVLDIFINEGLVLQLPPFIWRRS